MTKPISMIERVAVAISGAPFSTKASRRKARAAIEAMREPTPAVSAAMNSAITAGELSIGVMAAAVDAALSEEGE